MYFRSVAETFSTPNILSAQKRQAHSAVPFPSLVDTALVSFLCKAYEKFSRRSIHGGNIEKSEAPCAGNFTEIKHN